MPKLNWKLTRKLNNREQVLSVSYIDGLIEKIETIKTWGGHDTRITVGGESLLVGEDQFKTLGLSVNSHIRGFVIECLIPDDGPIPFIVNDFYSML